ncbi:MAG: ABC transporter substrate-binding protein [Pseudomonadota bacterium]
MKRINPILLVVVCMVCVGFLSPSFASAEEPYILGLPTSLGFPDGAQALNAVTMAVEEINAKGGVNVGGVKRTFQVEAIDIRDAAPGVPVPEALLGIEKVILDKKAQTIVVGPYRSEALMAAFDIFSKYKVPMLGTIAMSPASDAKVRENPEKYKYIFRVGENSKSFVGYMLGTMKFMNKEFGFNKLFIMHQDVMWTRMSAQIISDVLGKQGWTIAGSEAYPTGASDFSAGLMKAKAAGAQIIFPAFDMPQSGILVKQWKSMKVPAMLAGCCTPLAGSEAWKTFDKKIGGTIMMIMEIGNIPVAKVPASVKFYEAYTKRWGKGVQSTHGPAGSYEAIYILADAMERAGSVDPDAIVAALEKTDRMGVLGREKFDEGHQLIFGNDPSETALGCAFQWREGGKQVSVYPESIADDKIQLPPWMKKK